MESEFLPIGNSILLFTAFVLLVEIIISFKLRFHYPKIRSSLKNTFPLDGEKMTGFSEKWTKKMISTSPKNSCPLARMSSFSQNCFLLIPIMVSTEWNSTDQKVLFPLGKWRILKNRFPLYGNAASTLKNLWKIEQVGVPWQEYGSSLKNWLSPNFNNSFHLQIKTRNKTIDKKIKTAFPPFQYVLVKWENCFHW